MSGRRQAGRSPAARRTGRRWLWALLGGVAVLTAIWVTAAGRRPQDHAAVGPMPAVGDPAPAGAFTTVEGKTLDVRALRGRPALVWFVATWCPSCQTGTQVLAQKVNDFSGAAVRIVELELYHDLGGQGPDIATFGRQFAGNAYGNPDWTWGTASEGMSFRYDPKGYLDVYYLLDARGVIRYINGSPGTTLGDLSQQVARIGG